MKVKIIQSQYKCWYSNRINEIFEVKEIVECNSCCEGFSYSVIDKDRECQRTLHIAVGDCVEVYEEPKSELDEIKQIMKDFGQLLKKLGELE